MDRFRKNCSEFFSIPVILSVIIILLIINDKGTTAALGWLAVVFVMSFFMRPYFPSAGITFLHGGFALSFGLGLFLCFFFSWTLSALGVCGFDDPVIFTSFIVLSGIGYVIRRFVTKERYIRREDLRHLLNGFAVFAVIFLVFFWVIGFNPLVDPSTENYMDFGLMQTIYRQRSALPYDLWFSQTKLDHYYYLGQSMAVCMCRLALTTPEYGYNMMLATFAGMVFSMGYEIIGGIFRALAAPHPKRDLCASAGGAVGASLAAFGANPHWAVYGFILPAIAKMFGGEVSSRYWFPDGTVYIDMEYGDPDNGKTEFPAYSVILGDLHAHVINLIFVLVLLALLFEYVMVCRDDDDDENASRSKYIYRLTLISLLLGYFKGANYWDFAIYYVMTGAVIVFSDIRRRGSVKKAVGAIASKAVFITVVSVVSILPFTLNFAKMESGFALCENHTPPAKIAVLWLLPAAAAAFLVFLLYRGRDEYDGICRSSLLAFVLCTAGLVITPEIIYVKDIYGKDNSRFNTMFKLTYQAYTLFALIAGILFAVIVYKIFTGSGRRTGMKTVLVFFSVYALLSVSYTFYSSRQWFGNVFDAKERKGISSLDGLEDDPVYGFEAQALAVLMEDDSRVINIIEAAGNNYTHGNALSVYSGACTPLGWYVHEWMWHNDPEPVRQRSEQVSYFYSSSDAKYCREFLKAYDIDYIFVGPAEVCRYPVYSDIFKDFGDICVSTVWQERELFLLKVDKSLL